MAEHKGNDYHLSLDSLGELLEAIYSASLKWYNLGLRLGLQVPVLDAIGTKFSQDPETCLREMLREWLKRGSPTPSWKELVDALMSTAVGEMVLGTKLKRKHCKKLDDSSTELTDDVFLSGNDREMYIDKSSPVEAKPGDNSPDSKRSLVYSTSFSDQHSSDSFKEEEIRQAFGCGCGKCCLTTFLDKGCPEPVKSLSSFPYLRTLGLNQGEVMILKGRLFNQFQLITRSFSRFNTAICTSLINQEVSVKVLARTLRDLRAFQPSEADTPLLRDRFEAIKSARDVDDVFDILADYVSFFSFHITEHIVENLGTSDDKKLLANYKGELAEYCKRNIFECPCYSAPKPGVANLMMKVEGIEKYNLKHLAELISHVSTAISVSQHTLQLCSVERGCVQLNFQVPHFVKEGMFPLTDEQRVSLASRQIILIRCEKWAYELSEEKVKTPTPSTSTLESPKGAVQADTLESISSHGRISRQESETRLTSVDYDCFLLRDSETRPGCITLSVKQKGVLSHVLVENTELGYVPLGEVSAFKSIQSLVDHVNSYLPPCPFPGDDDTLKRNKTIRRQSDDSWLSDCTSDFTDCTGETTGDWTGGTGDSGVILSSQHPPPIPPKNTGPMYEKLKQGNRDKDNQYSNRYKLLKIERSRTPSPVQMSEAMASKQETGSSKQKKTERMYENSLEVHADS